MDSPLSAVVRASKISPTLRSIDRKQARKSSEDAQAAGYDRFEIFWAG